MLPEEYTQADRDLSEAIDVLEEALKGDDPVVLQEARKEFMVAAGKYKHAKMKIMGEAYRKALAEGTIKRVSINAKEDKSNSI